MNAAGPLFEICVDDVGPSPAAAMEKRLKPAACSVRGCSNEWAGARIDPQTGAFRWVCSPHLFSDWSLIHGLDAAASSAEGVGTL
jgi:hypothetical protein